MAQHGRRQVHSWANQAGPGARATKVYQTKCTEAVSLVPTQHATYNSPLTAMLRAPAGRPGS